MRVDNISKIIVKMRERAAAHKHNASVTSNTRKKTAHEVAYSDLQSLATELEEALRQEPINPRP